MNKTLIALSLSALVGFTSGCATSYQRVGLTGGYTDTQLAPDVFRVNFDGNGFTTKERAQDFVLLRAAEVSQEKGFPYFAILSSDAYFDQRSSVILPGAAYTTFSGFAAYTTFTPASSFAINKPQTEVMVQGFTTKPADRYSFDVAFLTRSLKQKYRVQ